MNGRSSPLRRPDRNAPSASRRRPWSQLTRSCVGIAVAERRRRRRRGRCRAARTAPGKSCGSTSGKRRATVGCMASRSRSRRPSGPSGSASSSSTASRTWPSAGDGRSSTVCGSSDADVNTSRASGRYVSADAGGTTTAKSSKRSVSSRRTQRPDLGGDRLQLAAGIGRGDHRQAVVVRRRARGCAARGPGPRAAAWRAASAPPCRPRDPRSVRGSCSRTARCRAGCCRARACPTSASSGFSSAAAAAAARGRVVVERERQLARRRAALGRALGAPACRSSHSSRHGFSV